MAKASTSALQSPPYALDTSQSKIEGGVPLYPLVATRDFEMTQALNAYMRKGMEVTKGTRGGWVPSLDVLEYSSKGFPWLDAQSEVHMPSARLRGALYLQGSVWASPFLLEGPVHQANTWFIESSTFSGKTRVSVRVPSCKQEEKAHLQQWSLQESLFSSSPLNPHLSDLVRGCVHSKFHNAHIQGPIDLAHSKVYHTTLRTHGRIAITSSELNTSHVKNYTPGNTNIHHSDWVGTTFHNGQCPLFGATHLNMEKTFWTNTTVQLGHAERADRVLHIQSSRLRDVHSTHGAVSHTDLQGALKAPFVMPPCPQGHDPAALRAVPLWNRVVLAKWRPSHVVWYNTAKEPVAIYDALSRQLVAFTDLSVYIDSLKNMPSISHQVSATTLQWWQWQHALGIEPPTDELWACPVFPPHTTDVSSESVNFGELHA